MTPGTQFKFSMHLIRMCVFLKKKKKKLHPWWLGIGNALIFHFSHGRTVHSQFTVDLHFIILSSCNLPFPWQYNLWWMSTQVRLPWPWQEYFIHLVRCQQFSVLFLWSEMILKHFHLFDSSSYFLISLLFIASDALRSRNPTFISALHLWRIAQRSDQCGLEAG